MVEEACGQIQGRSRKVLLWGAGSKARIIEEMLSESGLGDVSIIFDASKKSLGFESDAVFLNDANALKRDFGLVTHFVVCIGREHGFARVKTSEFLSRCGLQPVTVIHNNSFVEPTAKFGAGCQIMPCAVVHKFSSVGDYVIINTNATVEHECVLGNGVHVMGNAALAGKVEVGDYATIGTNATVLPYLKIGEGAFIGAGAVVTKDVKPYSVVAGVPAKFVRENKFVFDESSIKKLAAMI